MMKIRQSLAYQLLKLTFSIYLLITLSITSVHMYIEWNEATEFLKQDLLKLGNSAKDGLVLALWDLEYEKVKVLAQGLADQPIVIGVGIKDQQIEKFYGKKGDIQKTYALIQEEGGDMTYRVGEMTLYSSRSIVFQRLKKGYLLLVLNAAIKTLALWLLILWVGNKLITKPLQSLSQVNQQMNWDDLENFQRIDLGFQEKNNELSILENSFNDMFRKLVTARQELEQGKQNLEDQVELRTEELQKALLEVSDQHRQLKLAQAQLVHAEKMASLGTLVAGVAHEVNNPTSFINISAYNLQEGLNHFKETLLELTESENVFEEEFQSFKTGISYIQEGSLRLKTIVQDLRTFSRLDESDYKPANVVDGIRSTLRLVKIQYQKSVEFIEIFEAEPEIDCWPAQLNQAFMHLIVNACHAIQVQQRELDSQELGTLEICTLLENQQLIIHFIDTGCGMTPEEKDQMFDPFFSTKETGQGSGLGLSVTYGIIKKHHGFIDAHSKKGKGSTITITLPLAYTSES